MEIAARRMEIVAHYRSATGHADRDAAAVVRRALASGAERIELDALVFKGRLVVAHDSREAQRGTALAFDAALAFVAGEGRGLLADVKSAAAAAELGDLIAASGYGPRTVVSGALADVDAVARRSGATRAWTLPAAPGAHPAAHAGPVSLATRASRQRVEHASVWALTTGRCEAVAIERRFVTASLVAAVHAAGGRLLVWTVDRTGEFRRLAGLGVDAVVTNDPVGARAVLDRATADRGG
jgi:glycerophosphoryl diester phosphodiesterase